MSLTLYEPKDLNMIKKPSYKKSLKTKTLTFYPVSAKKYYFSFEKAISTALIVFSISSSV
jgi:hypothetical protein